MADVMAEKQTKARAGRRKRPDLPSLPGLIAETGKLRRELQKLVNRFPNDAEDPEGPIFPVLLSHRWRNLTSGPLGPYDEKRTLAIRWINQAWAYVAMLEEYFKNIRLEPETLQKLAFNGNGQYSAEE